MWDFSTISRHSLMRSSIRGASAKSLRRSTSVISRTRQGYLGSQGMRLTSTKLSESKTSTPSRTTNPASSGSALSSRKFSTKWLHTIDYTATSSNKLYVSKSRKLMGKKRLLRKESLAPCFVNWNKNLRKTTFRSKMEKLFTKVSRRRRSKS